MTQKIKPDEMTVKAICLKCRYYDKKGGVCTGVNPYAKTGDTHYLLLPDKTSCFGFDEA